MKFHSNWYRFKILFLDEYYLSKEFLNINILLEIQNKWSRIYFASQNTEISLVKVCCWMKIYAIPNRLILKSVAIIKKVKILNPKSKNPKSLLYICS